MSLDLANPLVQRLGPWAESLKAAVPLLRPVPLVLVVAWALQPASDLRAGRDRTGDLVQTLAARGLAVDTASIRWLDGPAGWASLWRRRTRVAFLAHEADGSPDVHLGAVREAPSGRLIAVETPLNLSQTTAATEADLVARGGTLAWTAGAETRSTVRIIDVAAPERLEGEGWTLLKRWQQRLTNLQDTGRLAGFRERGFRLVPARKQVTLAFDGPALRLDDGRAAVAIPLDGPLPAAKGFEEQTISPAPPGNLVTWGVDRARAVPWIGSDTLQLIKAVAFAGLDRVRQLTYTEGQEAEEAARVKEEMGEAVALAPVRYTDPETGWPPKALEPVFKPLEGEGQWRSLENDPFIRKNPSAPAPFITTFIRTDRKRRWSRIYLVMWDPRQVEFHTMSGVAEPKTATGQTGPGLIPRKPEVMGRLLAAMNGGFQALHGEFGMMANDVVYLPPKPYAATVARLRDGSTAFGTWPADPTVPASVVDFRQNMTPLVMDGTRNPYKRNWWGGVPPGWKDESRTVRSAICLTSDGFAVYFYGTAIDADHLAVAMERAHCDYGIHLDMNAGHTGLEFYHAAPTAELPAIDRKLDRVWEKRDELSDMPGWSFLGRRMIKWMGLMNFPRYIRREGRDFFYLTLRPVLPGPSLALPDAPGRAPAPMPASSSSDAPANAKDGPAAARDGDWVVQGLPQRGWPYALARTSLVVDAARGTRARVLKVDPRMVSPRAAAAAGGDRPVVPVKADAQEVGAMVLTLPAPASAGTPVWWHGGAAGVGAPPEGAVVLARAAEAPLPRTAAALGVDGDGHLVYAEIASGADPTLDGKALGALLRRAGCAHPVFFPDPLAIALGGLRTLAGGGAQAGPLKLARRRAPGARRLFPETPVVPARTWYPLQSKRIRYFKKKKKKKPEEDSGEE